MVLTAYGNNNWNLIGNPYPSFIDCDSFYNNNAGIIQPNFYFWNQNYGVNGGYCTYNAFSGVKIPNDTTVSKYIPPTQGFFVKAGITDSILFANNQRVHGNQLFYKTTKNYKNLYIKAKAGDYEDETMIYFHPDAQIYTEKCDAQKLKNNDILSLYTLSSENTDLIINGLPESETIVPLIIESKVNRNIRLSFEGFSTFNENERIYLEDKKMQTLQDLKKQNIFEFTNDTLDNNKRLYIHFKNSIIPNYNIYKVIRISGLLYIETPIDKKSNISIYNLLGELIYYKENTRSLIGVDLGNHKGVFIVKITAFTK